MVAGGTRVSARRRLFATLSMIAVLTAVGFIEAWRTEAVGLLVLLAVIEVLTVGIIVTLHSSGPIMVRADLAAWLDATSAVTGESASVLADRALSAYRATLSDVQRD